jgi:hypothetical protein
MTTTDDWGNEQRAEAARAALAMYAERARLDIDTQGLDSIADLLADLLHLAAQVSNESHGSALDDALDIASKAIEHFQLEACTECGVGDAQTGDSYDGKCAVCADANEEDDEEDDG